MSTCPATRPAVGGHWHCTRSTGHAGDHVDGVSLAAWSGPTSTDPADDGPGPHLPAQPAWVCVCCPGGVPWPCRPAVLLLMRAYRGRLATLAADMARMTLAAVRDRPDLPTGELWERMVSWVRAAQAEQADQQPGSCAAGGPVP